MTSMRCVTMVAVCEVRLEVSPGAVHMFDETYDTDVLFVSVFEFAFAVDS